MTTEEMEGFILDLEVELWKLLERVSSERFRCYRVNILCVLGGTLIDMTMTPKELVVTEVTIRTNGDDDDDDDDDDDEDEDDGPGEELLN